MRLTREQFDLLVRGVEQRHEGRTDDLRRQLARLVVLGYAGLLASLLGAILLSALFFAAMFYVDGEGRVVLAIAGFVVLAAGGWATLRVLLVKLRAPEGHRVTRADAPALHQALDELTATLRSIPFDEILVTPAFNASVAQVPKLGVFGWSRSYLLLGLPLMEQLAPDEFRAVLAHELAHLSRGHGRFSRWIYRVRLTWGRVFEEMSRPEPVGFSFRPLIIKFVDWFWPRFNAHAFVLSRHNEYEADSVAARTVGAGQLANSLQRMALHTRHLEERVWSDIWKLAQTEATPPNDVFTRVCRALRTGPSEEERFRWMEQEFRVTTTNADTHPCLSDRLRAVGQLPALGNVRPLPAPGQSAAEVFFGPVLESIRSGVEQLWRKETETNWRQQYARAAALEHRLTSLDQAPAATSADADTLWDRARVLLELQGDEQVRPLLKEVLAQQPQHAGANFHLGRALLERNDVAGEPHLQRVMNQESDWVPHACRVLHEHYHRLGRTDKMREIDARMDLYEQQLTASHAERSSVTATDTLIPHGLTDNDMAALQKTLALEPDLVRAELARKELKHFPDQKLFLLCIHRRPAWHRLPNTDAEQAMVNRLTKQVQLPGRVLIFSARGGFRALARKVSDINDAEVFRVP